MAEPPRSQVPDSSDPKNVQKQSQIPHGPGVGPGKSLSEVGRRSPWGPVLTRHNSWSPKAGWALSPEGQEAELCWE